VQQQQRNKPQQTEIAGSQPIEITSIFDDASATTAAQQSATGSQQNATFLGIPARREFALRGETKTKGLQHDRD
jgi:hypothetical protein